MSNYKIRTGTVKYGDKQCRADLLAVKKWDLEKGKWEEPTEENVGRVFSIVGYDTEFGKKDEEEFEIVLIVGGKRTENYNENGNGTGWGVQKYLECFDDMDKKIRVVSILVDNDGPLGEQAKLIAESINYLKGLKMCKKIHYLGVSKGGTMSVALLEHLTESDLDKIQLTSCFAPWLGTILASPVLLYDKIDEVMANAKKSVIDVIGKLIPYLANIKPTAEKDETIGDTNNTKSRLGNIIKKIHWNVFSQSHMDYDIVPVLQGEEGVPEEHLKRYDVNYLKGMFNEKAIEMLRKMGKAFINVTTHCTEETRQNAIKTRNLNAGALSVAAELLFDEESDGMVTEKSAREVERVAEENCINIGIMRIPNGHHDIETDARMVKLVVNRMLQREKEEDRVA